MTNRIAKYLAEIDEPSKMDIQAEIARYRAAKVAKVAKAAKPGVATLERALLESIATTRTLRLGRLWFQTHRATATCRSGWLTVDPWRWGVEIWAGRRNVSVAWHHKTGCTCEDCQG